MIRIELVSLLELWFLYPELRQHLSNRSFFLSSVFIHLFVIFYEFSFSVENVQLFV